MRVVTLSATKGLGMRFFALLRMTVLKSLVIKCTDVLHFDLVRPSSWIEHFRLDSDDGRKPLLHTGRIHVRPIRNLQD